jgi:hypothetical protein
MFSFVQKWPIFKETEGYVVAQLVEALRYKTEGSRFDSQLGH